MADRISARRGLANSFFLTANTGITGILGTENARWYLAAAGLVFCLSWWAILRSYRELNRAKFVVIRSIEDRLPLRIFGDEWDLLREQRSQRWFHRYQELGQIERIVPWLFALIYVAEIVRELAK